MSTNDPMDDLTNLKTNVDKLVSSLHKSSDIQDSLTKKVQWGCKTRPWRGLSQRYESLLASFDSIEQAIAKPYFKYFQSINKADLIKTASFLGNFIELFDNLESVKIPTAHFVILLYFIIYHKRSL